MQTDGAGRDGAANVCGLGIPGESPQPEQLPGGRRIRRIRPVRDCGENASIFVDKDFARCYTQKVASRA